MEFFARVAAVPQIEWGTRAFMYVYADEPICKAKSFGEKRFLVKSSKPTLDLQQLKEDYGSFAGWMTLNLRKTERMRPMRWTDSTSKSSPKISA